MNIYIFPVPFSIIWIIAIIIIMCTGNRLKYYTQLLISWHVFITHCLLQTCDFGSGTHILALYKDDQCLDSMATFIIIIILNSHRYDISKKR